MEFAVLVQQLPGAGYRAWCADPLPASEEGATRDEALAKLRDALARHIRGGVEVVRLRIDGAGPTTPVWPDDDLTRDWLAGIAAARAAAAARPDPWDAANVP